MTMHALIRDQEQRFAAEREAELRAEIAELEQDLALAHLRIEELESQVKLERGQREALR